MSTPESLAWDAEQDERYRSHEQANHDDPCDEDECSVCKNRVEEEIAEGIRCRHGLYIPYLDNGLSDVPCVRCGIDYGVALEEIWLDTLRREKI